MYRYIDKRTPVVYSFEEESENTGLILLNQSQYEFYEKNKGEITNYTEVIEEKLIEKEVVLQSIESIKQDLLLLANAESINAFNETIEPYVMSNILAGTYKNADILKIELDNLNKALHSEYENVKAKIEGTDVREELDIIMETLSTRFRNIASMFNFKGDW